MVKKLDKVTRLLLLTVLIVGLILSYSPVSIQAAAIDVGNDATNRAGIIANAFTCIDAQNPANDTGTITSIEVWAASDLTGFRVGTFYLVSGTDYKCRDSETIGNVTSGSKQTFSVSISVTAGDMIGFYAATGNVESDSSGGVSHVLSGEYIDPNDQATYNTGTKKFSVYGTGSTVSIVAPTVTTQAASSVSYTTATLNGNLTDLGSAASVTTSFQYGLTTAYGSTAAASESPMSATGTFHADISSLDLGTLYHFRAVADGDGDPVYGDDSTFTTLTQSPTVTTQAASNIEMDEDGVTAGVFNGNLTSLGDDTDADVSFIYGTTSACADDETTPVNVDATGAFYNDTEFPVDWTPGATYYYKSKAVNTHGTSYGSVQTIVFTMPTFTTQAATYTSPGVATADLNGNISNMGVATGCYAYFEYGTSTSYGSLTTPQTFTIADDVEDTISEFLHNVTIHYRLVIEVGETTSNGSDETFLIAPPTISGALWYQPITIVTNTSFDGIADAGSSDTALIDAELTQANDYWNFALLTITDTTDDLAPKGETAVITDFIAASDELQFAALTAALEAGDTYTVEFGTLTDRAGNEDGIITWGVNPDGITVSIGPVSGGTSGLVAPNPNGRHYDIAPPIGGEEYVVPNATPDTPLNPIMDAISTVMSISGSPFTVPVQILWIILATCVILACMVISMRYLPNQLIGSIVCIGLSILFWKLHVYPFAMVIFICFVCVSILIWERKPSV